MSALLTFALSHLSVITAAAGGAVGFKTIEVTAVKLYTKAKAWTEAKAAAVEAKAKADAEAVETKAKADAAQLDALIGAHVSAGLADIKKALGIGTTPPAA